MKGCGKDFYNPKTDNVYQCDGDCICQECSPKTSSKSEDKQ